MMTFFLVQMPSHPTICICELGDSSEKELRTSNREKSEKARQHTSDSPITNNVVAKAAVTLQGPQQEASNFNKISDDELYDEIDNTSEKIEGSNVNNIYDTPVIAQIRKENSKIEPEKLEQSADKTMVLCCNFTWYASFHFH